MIRFNHIALGCVTCILQTLRQYSLYSNQAFIDRFSARFIHSPPRWQSCLLSFHDDGLFFREGIEQTHQSSISRNLKNIVRYQKRNNPKVFHFIAQQSKEISAPLSYTLWPGLHSVYFKLFRIHSNLYFPEHLSILVIIIMSCNIPLF